MSAGTNSNPSRETLLATKLFIPQAHPDLVARPRLVARMIEGMSRKLTLVSAPPGAGKTTMLAEWRQSEFGQKWPLAWLTLDERDNDPNRFLIYLITALEKVVPDAGEGVRALLQSNNPADIEVMIAQLVNNLVGADYRYALVLEEYHTISNPLIHRGMDFLLEHMPPDMRLVIVSRIDPPLALARLRGRGELTEIRGTDLRFTRDEADRLFNVVAALGLTAEDIEILEQRTEGWAAGLQLAALSIRDRGTASAFIREFSGEHRYIVDYLIEEVLSRQPEDVQSFLLRTSILDRFCAGLCNAVTGGDDAAETIARLERDNLFVIPLDSERRWYRYHALFAELLRHRLSQLEPDCVPGLYHRASCWFDSEGIGSEAVHFALHSGDEEHAATLMEKYAGEILASGQIETLLRWLHSLNDNVRFEHPILNAWCIWAMLSSGRVEEIEPHLDALERYGEQRDVDNDGQRILAGILAAGRAAVAVHRRAFERTIELSDSALALLSPEEHPIAHSTTLYSRGFALALTGRVNESVDAFREAIRIIGPNGSTPFVLINRTALAQGLLHQLKFRESEAILRESLDYAARQGIETWPYVGFIRICLGRLLYEFGDLDAAREAIDAGIEVAQRWNTFGFQLEGRFSQTGVYLALGDLDAAAEALAPARSLVPVTGPNPLLERVNAYQALIDLERGDTERAAAWALPYVEAPVDDLTALWAWIAVYRGAARVLGSTGHHELARPMVERILCEAEERAWGFIALQFRVALARNYWVTGDARAAIEALEPALAVAEPEGVMRSLLDDGPEMPALLLAARPSSWHQAHIDRLLACGPAQTATLDPAAAVPNGNSKLIEPLSDRELEVLRLLAAGHSNAEIADQLYLAVGTVKRHTHNIYGKLGARTRTQAVARAHELDLLQPA